MVCLEEGLPNLGNLGKSRTDQGAESFVFVCEIRTLACFENDRNGDLRSYPERRSVKGGIAGVDR